MPTLVGEQMRRRTISGSVICVRDGTGRRTAVADDDGPGRTPSHADRVASHGASTIAPAPGPRAWIRRRTPSTGGVATISSTSTTMPSTAEGNGVKPESWPRTVVAIHGDHVAPRRAD